MPLSRWRSPAGERIRSFTISITNPNKLCAELHNRRVQRWPPLGNIFGTSIEEVTFA